MPPKTAASEAAATLNLTDGELKLALAMMKHVDRPTTAVLEKMAEEAGLSSASSARTLLARAATKHGWFAGSGSSNSTEDGSGSASTPRPKKTATPRKKKIAEVEEGAEEQGTPTKKRGRKSKAQKAAEEAAASASAAEAAAEKDADDEEIKESGDGAVKEETGDTDGAKEEAAEQK
ncbi:hypothetical protein CTAM01_16630 [Colletotrichum tamarilloi]|uniref:Uncharacterized protein n=1 Tax=Colletotrichum tamarilloi TaxID=1209934 RepID=A0ABQ9QI48_9PEZI|nr:uncharacterized protein CTAM01_16630 [Colletotrichum tamarilloi]KAK1471199.1 hypothetical protein CTAM01_16630 [Colletotrichum tamarilloi]